MFQLSNGQILPVVGFARKAAVDSRFRDIFVVATFEAYRLIASFKRFSAGRGVRTSITASSGGRKINSGVLS